MNEDIVPTLIFCGILFFGGLALFFIGFKIRHKKKLIENIPTSKIRSAAMGLVEIAGRATTFGDLLRAPFAEKECVYYRYRVQEQRGSGRNQHWVTIAKEETEGPFFVEDETGKILVMPKGAEFHLRVDQSYHNYSFFGRGAEQKAKFQSGLQNIGINPQGFLGMNRPLRCDEIFIEPGDTVYVMGSAQPSVLGTGSAVGYENLMLAKAEGQFFCISDRSEKKLLNKLRWQMIGALYGGPALSIGALFWLFRAGILK